MGFAFFVKNVLLGAGLAMDAFAVSLANGVAEPHMSGRKRALIAGAYALFQFMMPLVGWLCVNEFAKRFKTFSDRVPIIAFALLCFIGLKMIYEGLRGGAAEGMGAGEHILSLGELLLQALATSIDALSVGFTLSEYGAGRALCAAAVIAVTTFAICTAGVILGKELGTRLAGKGKIFGGLILIAVGLEIII